MYMKFQLVSNINLNKYKKLPSIEKIIKPCAPNLILAGNICYCKHDNLVEFFKKISPKFKHIFYILGKNEYFVENAPNLFSLSEVEYTIRDKLKEFDNVHLLQNDYIIIGGVVIIGATLWSYISKKDLVGNIMLPDQYFIKHNKQIQINPNITNKIHLTHKNWLKDILFTFEEYPKIVITHHLPSFKCLEKKIKFETFSKLYYSNCDRLIEKADIWCAGYSDVFSKKKIEGVPVYINPFGFLWDKTSYKKEFTLEL